MGSALVVALAKYGLLLLLWLFVLAAVRTVRSDLFGPGRQATQVNAPVPQQAPAKRGRREARRLVVTQGPLAGATITLDSAPVTLGRADGSTLVVTDDYASSQHARLVPGDKGWVLEDLGSTNGTYLGDDRVSAPTRVRVGQPIRIGRTVMELRR